MLCRNIIYYFALVSTIALCVADNHVTYGSAIVLRHAATKFKLFSTKMSWGFGSRQQIVTAMSEPDYDDSTLWIVKPKHSEVAAVGIRTLQPVDEGGKFDSFAVAGGSPVKCGDVVRFEHVETEKNLHSHHQKAAIAGANFEVCGYGTNGVGDSGDDFKVDCGPKETFWRLEAPVFFRHAALDAFLATSRKSTFTQSNCPRCPIVGHQEVSLQRVSDSWIAEASLMVERHEDDTTTPLKDEL